MESFYEKYYGKIKQQRKDDILELMHLAVDLNQKEWFEELCELYNAMWGLR